MKFKLFSLMLIALCFKAHSASFDCTKARSQVEKAICSNSELSKLDEVLAEVYKLSVRDYPVENYVRARQREWIKDNNYCGKDKMVFCLKEKYEKRLTQLKKISITRIYSNSPKFNYSDGDAVAEIWQHDGKFNIYVWGGFRLHKQASNDAGISVYTGCEFEGYFTAPNGGKAVGLINGEIKGDFDFKIVGNKLTYSDDTQICEGGFARLPEELVLFKK